jgi:hypothetical protein
VHEGRTQYHCACNSDCASKRDELPGMPCLSQGCCGFGLLRWGRIWKFGRGERG